MPEQFRNVGLDSIWELCYRLEDGAKGRSSCLRFKRESWGWNIALDQEWNLELRMQHSSEKGAPRRDTGIGKSGISTGLGAQMKAGQRPGVFRVWRSVEVKAEAHEGLLGQVRQGQWEGLRNHSLEVGTSDFGTLEAELREYEGEPSMILLY